MNTVQLVKAGNKIKLQGLLYHNFELHYYMIIVS